MTKGAQMESEDDGAAAIQPDDVAAVFDDARIKALARKCKLPKETKIEVFAREVRRAASIYATDARAPNVNDLHREISGLHKAASLRRHERVADLLTKLSPTARNSLAARGAIAAVSTVLPAPDDLCDPTKREAACAAVERLCAYGGRWAESRMRPSGRPSWTWRPYLWAPDRSRHFDRREAERAFVTNLRAAVLEATGKPPARTAGAVKKGFGVWMISGPFARMVAECLRLVGASRANAVELINELDRRRPAVEARRPVRADGETSMPSTRRLTAPRGGTKERAALKRQRPT
jgi:hypothetical protein